MLLASVLKLANVCHYDTTVFTTVEKEKLEKIVAPCISVVLCIKSKSKHWF